MMEIGKVRKIEVAGVKYVFFYQTSGNRGTYNQWCHIYARSEAGYVADPHRDLRVSERYVTREWTRLSPDKVWSESQLKEISEEIFRLKDRIWEADFPKPVEKVPNIPPEKDPEDSGEPLLGKSTLVRRGPKINRPLEDD